MLSASLNKTFLSLTAVYRYQELLEKRRQLMDEYAQFCKEKSDEFDHDKERRIELRDGN